jgi:hypothetical protein
MGCGAREQSSSDWTQRALVQALACSEPEHSCVKTAGLEVGPRFA